MTYFYPPEWEKQAATWLSYPHNNKEWGKDRIEKIRNFYTELISNILDFQDVKLVFFDEQCLNQFKNSFTEKKYKLHKIIIPNNDIWIRDYGPFFLIRKTDVGSQNPKLLLDFEFNSWGGKFPPWDLDNNVPKEISQYYGLDIESYPMILEGGSVEFSGDDILLTTEQCLLNENRNSSMNKNLIESILKSAFNIHEVIWLKRGLEGDHTDGHIDDFARFISHNKLIVCKPSDKNDSNYNHLCESIEFLKSWKHKNKNYRFEIIEVPLPKPMYLEGERLPNSYANFIFVNEGIILPLFNCEEDSIAIDIFKKSFPDRKIVGIDSTLLIEEGGGLHCMTKQEPY